MLFSPCGTVGSQSEEAYERRMTGAGLVYQDRQKMWARCPDCTADLVAGLLLAHGKTQQSIGMIAQWETPTPHLVGGGGGVTYV